MKKIKSIKQALVMLGLKELKKWFFLMYIRDPAKKINPIQNEITKMSMTRAKVCELLALETGKGEESSSYFLTGLLSLIDNLLNQPLEIILSQLPLDQEIKETFRGGQNSYRVVLDLSIHLKKGEWQEIRKVSQQLGVEHGGIFQLYINAMKWTQEVMNVELMQYERVN